MKTALIATVFVVALLMPRHMATDFRKATCVPQQVCQTCYRQDGSAYQCNCHLECLPGIH